MILRFGKQELDYINYQKKYYGDAEYWWLIAWYNNKPTESHFKLGDVVYIPLPF